MSLSKLLLKLIKNKIISPATSSKSNINKAAIKVKKDTNVSRAKLEQEHGKAKTSRLIGSKKTTKFNPLSEASDELIKFVRDRRAGKVKFSDAPAHIKKEAIEKGVSFSSSEIKHIGSKGLSKDKNKKTKKKSKTTKLNSEE